MLDLHGLSVCASPAQSGALFASRAQRPFQMIDAIFELARRGMAADPPQPAGLRGRSKFIDGSVRLFINIVQAHALQSITQAHDASSGFRSLYPLACNPCLLDLLGHWPDNPCDLFTSSRASEQTAPRLAVANGFL